MIFCRLYHSLLVISFSLFRPIGENTKLETKYSKLFDLTEIMTATRINNRPTCEEILGKRNSWALVLGELMGMKDFEIPSEEIRAIEDSFHLYFVKSKLKYDLYNK